MEGPSIQDLRKEASALGVSGGGSKDDLAARIAAARAIAPNIDVREGDSVTVETLAEEAEDAIRGDADTTPEGTVWLGTFHVDIGSAAYDNLIARGYTPNDPPEGA